MPATSPRLRKHENFHSRFLPDDRDIIEGTLGCPICQAEYPIRDGVACFSDRAAPRVSGPVSEEDAVRVAAALDLTDARMTAILPLSGSGS